MGQEECDADVSRVTGNTAKLNTASVDVVGVAWRKRHTCKGRNQAPGSATCTQLTRNNILISSELKCKRVRCRAIALRNSLTVWNSLILLAANETQKSY